MNFMPMMPSQLAFTSVHAASLLEISDTPRNQMEMNPQNALGYPEDEEQQQEQQAVSVHKNAVSSPEIMNLQRPGQSHCAQVC